MATPYNAYRQWQQTRRQETVEQNLDLVYRIARRVLAAVGQDGRLEYGDLVNAGILGLYDAIDRYDAGRGVPFAVFAGRHIRGRILDEVARHRQLPRSLRDKQVRLHRAVDELSQRLMRTPSDEEVRAQLGLSEKEYQSWLADCAWTAVWSVEELEQAGQFDVVEERAEASPEATMDWQETRAELIRALRQLNVREQQVLYAYYVEELTMKETADVVGVSESQISRIHSRALAKLRDLLGGQQRGAPARTEAQVGDSANPGAASRRAKKNRQSDT
ncbi:sigma-70 family RNA polymerase sigma factor [Alicyclobacillus shizuokensis]|uniref:sigma-70 family RNA polymerase sigma factor n=1 Tax=Alicyclobacillus shizuokensis TaxID=392014 RepID=UPI00082A29AE|nr:FliA/WhiG family RNA polymerase sigma factor [Alicyclobacillus shizuokensis]MCL6625441.1 FliA/WhiG family RNA polymerase sigma factor [Alicyclobacillus shizuokensis]